MQIPASNHFTPLELDDSFNCDRATLDDLLRLTDDDAFGDQNYRGIPFALGAANQANVILLHDEAIRISTAELQATYLVFTHIVEDRPLRLTPDLADYDGVPHRNDDRARQRFGRLGGGIPARVLPMAAWRLRRYCGDLAFSRRRRAGARAPSRRFRIGKMAWHRAPEKR